jgi:hypothetical protein
VACCTGVYDCKFVEKQLKISDLTFDSSIEILAVIFGGLYKFLRGYYILSEFDFLAQ